MSASPVVHALATSRLSTPHQPRHAPGLELARQSRLAIVIAACVPRPTSEGRSEEPQLTRRPTPNPCYSRAILSSASAQGATRDHRRKKENLTVKKAQSQTRQVSDRSHRPARRAESRPLKRALGLRFHTAQVENFRAWLRPNVPIDCSITNDKHMTRERPCLTYQERQGATSGQPSPAPALSAL